MMESFKVGDRVNFLNDQGGGVVNNTPADVVYHPLHAPFSLRTSRFFKDGSFVDSGLLGEKAMMICLSTSAAMASISRFGVGAIDVLITDKKK